MLHFQMQNHKIAASSFLGDGGSNRQKVENIVKIIQFQSMSLLNLRAKVLIGHFIPACTVYHIWIEPLSVAI